MNRLTTIISWFCYAMLAMAVLTFILMVLNNHEVSTTYKPLSYQERMALNELVVRSTKLHK